MLEIKNISYEGYINFLESHNMWRTLMHLIPLIILSTYLHGNLKNKLITRLKIWFSNPFIFSFWWYKFVIFLTYIIRSSTINCRTYQKSTTSGCGDIRIFKLEFVKSIQFLHIFINLQFFYFKIISKNLLSIYLLIFFWNI